MFRYLPAVLLALPTLADAQSAAAREFFDKHIIIDGICFPYYQPGTALHRFPRQPDGTFDMADYRAGTGVDLAVWDIRTPEEMAKMVDAVENKRFRNTVIVRHFEDIKKMFQEKHHGWLFHTQQPWPLQGTAAPVDDWYRDGLRMLQFVYGSTLPVPAEDKLGTGSSTSDDETSGLTALGREVVGACNRLGIVIDVSHCNRQTTLDICATTASPVTCSHAGCDAIVQTRRNKTDEEIRAIAETGGVFGITPVKFMISNGTAGATMDDFIAHLEHAIRIAGIDHVGVGSDLKRNGVPERETHAYTCPELNSEERWYHLYEALHKRDYSNEDLAKIFGQNFLRVLREVLR